MLTLVGGGDARFDGEMCFAARNSKCCRLVVGRHSLVSERRVFVRRDGRKGVLAKQRLGAPLVQVLANAGDEVPVDNSKEHQRCYSYQPGLRCKHYPGFAVKNDVSLEGIISWRFL